MNQQLKDEADRAPLQSYEPRTSHSKAKSDLLDNLAKWVSSKLEEGDYKGAVRLASSDDLIADEDEARINALRSKHPSPHPDILIPPFPSDSGVIPSILVQEDEVARAINLFFPLRFR